MIKSDIPDDAINKMVIRRIIDSLRRNISSILKSFDVPDHGSFLKKTQSLLSGIRNDSEVGYVKIVNRLVVRIQQLERDLSELRKTSRGPLELHAKNANAVGVNHTFTKTATEG
ncbi:hypothetical protein RF11_00920 [Thelohanellus kitauei]|uniref:Uncharacterized protein n=1 Tax=Thelohanellus kitauei TaxID=669202 RepID=A0A0C2IJK4_THEKT|nr:hypothetical protein RF11_00920 [Thelohanellus kitauei]